MRDMFDRLSNQAREKRKNRREELELSELREQARKARERKARREEIAKLKSEVREQKYGGLIKAGKKLRSSTKKISKRVGKNVQSKDFGGFFGSPGKRAYNPMVGDSLMNHPILGGRSQRAKRKRKKGPKQLQ